MIVSELRLRRQRLGLTGCSVAKAIGITHRTLISMEKGNDCLKSQMDRLLDYLDMKEKEAVENARQLIEQTAILDNAVTNAKKLLKQYEASKVAIANAKSLIEHYEKAKVGS